MSIFLYAQFLRFRYHLSSYTRQAFTKLRVVLDNVSQDPRVPPVVARVYVSAKDMVIRYGQAVVQQQPRQ